MASARKRKKNLTDREATKKAEATGAALDELAQKGPGYLKYAGEPEGVVNFDDNRTGPAETATEATSRELFGDRWPRFRREEITAVAGRLDMLGELLFDVLGSSDFPQTTITTIRRASEMLTDLGGAAFELEQARDRVQRQRFEAAVREAWSTGDERVRAAIVETENRMRENCEQLIAAAKKELRRGKRSRK